MRKFKTLAITSPSFSGSEALVRKASALADTIRVNQAGTKWTEETLIEFLSHDNADAAIVGTELFGKSIISKLPHLKAVGKYGVGMDNIDVDALKDRGIYFGWTGGVNKRSVSELVLSFMLSHLRNVFRSVDRMQNGVWQKNGGVQLSNRSVGIIGLGHIGTDLATLLKAFGCKIYYFDIADKSAEAKSLGIDYLNYADLISLCDVVTFHVPGGAGTKNLYSSKEISSAKSGQLLINTARSSVVDFEAVAAAVKSGTLSGFASDVFPEEPFFKTSYRIEDGFYFTPHIGGNAAEAVEAMGTAALDSLILYLSQNH